LNLSSEMPSICSLFGLVSIKGLLVVIGSKKSRHGWSVDEGPSRGFKFISMSIWERTFLVSIKDLLVVIGSKKYGHGWPVD